mmetsp:Transcript_86517/g.243845  ORF Transcript_86517/g.243845 Transcript_86517/m.243845 type:complete len:201 (+) Transcript_86517:415-1017(+)
MQGQGPVPPPRLCGRQQRVFAFRRAGRIASAQGCGVPADGTRTLRLGDGDFAGSCRPKPPSDLLASHRHCRRICMDEVRALIPRRTGRRIRGSKGTRQRLGKRLGTLRYHARVVAGCSVRPRVAPAHGPRRLLAGPGRRLVPGHRGALHWRLAAAAGPRSHGGGARWGGRRGGHSRAPLERGHPTRKRSVRACGGRLAPR